MKTCELLAQNGFFPVCTKDVTEPTPNNNNAALQTQNTDSSGE
jgi:hypothetical protein